MNLQKKIKFVLPSETMEAEVDLDIRPFMNVLLILIPFLASVAVYTRLSIIEMNLPPNVGAGMNASAEKPKLKMTVVVKTEGLSITYGEKLLEDLPKAGAEYDYELLREKLLLHREESEVKDEVIVAVADSVKFQFVVRVMDACRKTGFAKIGMAAATENPESGE